MRGLSLGWPIFSGKRQVIQFRYRMINWGQCHWGGTHFYIEIWIRLLLRFLAVLVRPGTFFLFDWVYINLLLSALHKRETRLDFDDSQDAVHVMTFIDWALSFKLLSPTSSLQKNLCDTACNQNKNISDHFFKCSRNTKVKLTEMIQNRIKITGLRF